MPAGTSSVGAPPRRILFIRRDNIGDLVLTTPLIHAVRRKLPDAWIGVLGNSYNAPVLAAHPDIDAVFAYDKAKHRPDLSRAAVWVDTLRLLIRLRGLRIDLVILAGPGAQRQAARLARWLGAGKVAGFVVGDQPPGVTLPVPYGDGASLHEAEDVFRLGGVLGVEGQAGRCVLEADRAERTRCHAALAPLRSGRRVVAVHLSARRPSQKWPAEKFAALMASPRLRDCVFVLLWSPGPSDDPRHPGDDRKAAEVARRLGREVAHLAWPTATLAGLSGALAECDLMVCADGGAMHVAAGLGVPVVALFGDSPVRRWRPWGVPARALTSPAGHVDAIEVDEVAAACESMLAERGWTGEAQAAGRL